MRILEILLPLVSLTLAVDVVTTVEVVVDVVTTVEVVAVSSGGGNSDSSVGGSDSDGQVKL